MVIMPYFYMYTIRASTLQLVFTCGWFLQTSNITLRTCNFPSSLSARVLKTSWNLLMGGKTAYINLFVKHFNVSKPVQCYLIYSAIHKMQNNQMLTIKNIKGMIRNS